MRAWTMNTKLITEAAAPETRELQDLELDAVSGAGLHFTVFGVQVDVTGDGVCVSSSKTTTCKWSDGTAD
jgi:hypothetical protein